MFTLDELERQDPVASFRYLEAFYKGIAPNCPEDAEYANNAALRCSRLAKHFSGKQKLNGTLSSDLMHFVADIGWARRNGYL